MSRVYLIRGCSKSCTAGRARVTERTGVHHPINIFRQLDGIFFSPDLCTEDFLSRRARRANLLCSILLCRQLVALRFIFSILVSPAILADNQLHNIFTRSIDSHELLSYNVVQKATVVVFGNLQPAARLNHISNLVLLSVVFTTSSIRTSLEVDDLISVWTQIFGSAAVLPVCSKRVFVAIDAYAAVLRSANTTLCRGNALDPPCPRMSGLGLGFALFEKRCFGEIS